MSGIGGRAPRASGAGGADGTIAELEAQYEQAKSGIRELLRGKNDRRDLSTEQKDALRRAYMTAAQLAKKLSECVTDEEKSAQYKAEADKLFSRATSYGSVVKNTIPKTTMDDIKGLTEVKSLVDSFLFMAQHTDILKDYNMQGGLGVLMYGAPGTGKTMFAEAIANKMQLPLFIVTPADIFKSYVGASEQAVRAIFQDIDACPDGAVLFIDECESIFSRRNENTQDYKAAVTTELLQRINGFGVDGSKRIMVGATNRPEMIDPAYLRYKRFSYLIHVTPPDYDARKAIIESKLKNIKLEDGLTKEEVVEMAERYRMTESEDTDDFGRVSKGEAYYSAADLCGIVEEACRLALEEVQRRNLDHSLPVTRENFERAFERIPPSISAQLLKTYEDFNKNRVK